MKRSDEGGERGYVEVPLETSRRCMDINFSHYWLCSHLAWPRSIS